MGIELIPRETDKKWPNLTPARYLGTPCSKCGCPVKNVANRGCVVCQKAKRDGLRARWKEENPEAHAESCRGATERTKARREHPDAAARERETNAARMRTYRADPAVRDLLKAKYAGRKKSGRRPVSVADRQNIVSVYKEARKAGMSVDHIIPLTHPLVCGLHVSWNMQILTLEENISKSNSFDETLGLAPVEK